MERGEPMQFVYRPMQDSQLPDQTVKFDDVWDAYIFARELYTECRRRGLDHLRAANKDEMRLGKGELLGLGGKGVSNKKGSRNKKRVVVKV